MENQKQCSICKEYFPAISEYFYKNKNNHIDGLSPYCKKCQIKKSSKNRKDNIEKKLKYDKEYRENNKKERKANFKRWRNDNLDNIFDRLKKWRENNPDKIKGYNEKRQHKNHKITKEEWIKCKEYFNNSCAYCNMTEEEQRKLFKQDLHKEHIDDNGSIYLDNCVPSCKSCNSSKHIATLEEWYNKDNPNYTKRRYNKIIKWRDKDHKKYMTIITEEN